MNATEKREFLKLKQHIEKCTSVPSDSFVSRVVLHRLDQRLANPNKAIPASASTYKSYKLKPKKEPQTLLQSLLSKLRIIIIDIPLTLTFLSIITTHLIYNYYTRYITPMIDAADWVNNDRLDSEYTYYDRPCDVSDISATDVEMLTLDSNNPIHDSDYAVENFMIHGMGLFKDVLDEKLSDNLRNYIRKRNYELTEEEIIPLDTPDNRHSFGIDANEDPSVALALNQIGSHTLLKETLEKLLGPDPAVAEITAITVEPGADSQGWHPDVKPQGNSLKYGQTFTHSYSIFIPLQNVTKRMGATELCPGTHYCSSDDLSDMCIRGGFQASESNDPRKAWKTGDGLMMNQKMWHRGGEYRRDYHDDSKNIDRVVFILTFISRPNFGVDHRQLSHGTYFHIHPFMYGHTFRDLKNAQVSMSWPFTMFRSIGIWKPPSANWGYDWVTTSSLRIANGENGYHFEDLEHFASEHPLTKMIPSFLQGEVHEEYGWKAYIEGSLSRFRMFLSVLYLTLLGGYVLILIVLDLLEGGKRRRFYSAFTRLVVINLTLVFLAHKAADVVKETQLCKSVDSKTIYARPFLRKSSLQYTRKQRSSIEAKEEISRPTTVPTKNDVLFGIRYDSKHIGNYINFLDYHPGNRELKRQLDMYTDLYHSYDDLPTSFQNQIVTRMESYLDRFLLQNDYGQWTVMPKEEKTNQILKHLSFAKTGMGLFPALDKELAILQASARFGTTIRTSPIMKQETLASLTSWRDDVLGKDINFIPPQTKMKINSSTTKTNGGNFGPSSLFKAPSNLTQIDRFVPGSGRERFVGTSPTHGFNIGDHVLFNYQGSGAWINGYIIHLEFNNYAYVERKFEDGLVERSGVYLKKVLPYVPIEEGQAIIAIDRECPACKNDFLYGTVTNVYPTFEYDIIYDSGEKDLRIDSMYLARAM